MLLSQGLPYSSVIGAGPQSLPFPASQQDHLSLSLSLRSFSLPHCLPAALWAPSGPTVSTSTSTRPCLLASPNSACPLLCYHCSLITPMGWLSILKVIRITWRACEENRLPDPTPSVCLTQGLGEPQECAFLTSPQVIPNCWGRDHILRIILYYLITCLYLSLNCELLEVRGHFLHISSSGSGQCPAVSRLVNKY